MFKQISTIYSADNAEEVKKKLRQIWMWAVSDIHLRSYTAVKYAS